MEVPAPAQKQPRRRATKAEPQPEPPEVETRPSKPRRVIVTGGAGFVGAAVVHRLADRGEDVVALVRDPARAGRIAESGATIVGDDLSSVPRLTELFHDADAVIHAAGSYRVGITKAERGQMWDANVGTTTRVLDAAEAAGTPRIVYVSTVNVFGNTRGQVVSETYRRDLREGFLSWYDETKYGAHEVAEQRISAGNPVVIVLPSQVYGPGDPTSIGDLLRLAKEGRLRYRAVDDVGLGFVHVDDLAAGVLAALDRGTVGRSYVLSGPTTRLRDAVAVVASLAGRKPPALRVPTVLIRALSRLGPLVGQPNLAEVLSASAGVTYWASAARAHEELDWTPRDIETGFRDAFGGR